MVTVGRRTRLKNQTAAAHARLDAYVDRAGFFASQSGYRKYLRATWQARVALESLLDLSGAGDVYPAWPERRLRGLLQQDLQDVGEPAGEVPGADGRAALNAGAVLGALYVLEGSSLGARLIERRVAQIGLGPEFGARHLARQATRGGSWGHFLELLEEVPLPPGDEEDCVRSALDAFARFEDAYREVG